MKCAEVAAFCVDPSYRNGGRGDSLLDYLEQKAREQNYDYLVLLTTRTADWFCCRGFKEAGVAYKAEILPESRRAKVRTGYCVHCLCSSTFFLRYMTMRPRRSESVSVAVSD
jgi:N-acetylglutamate synthase-like GNAT family acetyltransferase